MDLTGKRIAILAEELYEDLELWYPALRFREAGAEVTIVGTNAETGACQTASCPALHRLIPPI